MLPETPPIGTVATASSARSAAPTMPVAAAAAAVISASYAALSELVLPPTRRGTRRSVIEVAKQMAQERAAYELTRLALQG
eukprot:6289992-Prymnesium_polylepis.1